MLTRTQWVCDAPGAGCSCIIQQGSHSPARDAPSAGKQGGRPRVGGRRVSEQSPQVSQHEHHWRCGPSPADSTLILGWESVAREGQRISQVHKGAPHRLLATFKVQLDQIELEPPNACSMNLRWEMLAMSMTKSRISLCT